MKVQLTRKTWCAFGYKGEGKSSLSKHIATEYKSNALYYDPLWEVPETAPFDSYQPKERSSLEELEAVVNLVKQGKKYRMFIIDEANRYCPPKPKPLSQVIQDMNDWCRHPQYNLSVGYIARRPTQINTDLTEIADYLFIFNLGGKNDIKYLNDLRAGLGGVVRDLPQFHFAIVDKKRNYIVSTPVDLNKIYHKI